MNTKIKKQKSIDWNNFCENGQGNITQALALHAVKNMTVQDYGHCRRVCKLWNTCLSDQNVPTFQKLQFFQPLRTPIFKRFVILVSQIDTTPTPKCYLSPLR